MLSSNCLNRCANLGAGPYHPRFFLSTPNRTASNGRRYFLKIKTARRALVVEMGWLVGVVLALEAVLRVAPVIAVFIFAIAFGGALVEETWQRVAIGLGA